MNIATWNVNGIRARQTQFAEWIKHDQPDVVCLQEIKASPAQVPEAIRELPDYWSYWHGAGGYSGVALLLRKEAFREALPEAQFSHPVFDFENRIVQVQVDNLILASVYVPNGGKDFEAKVRFLEGMTSWVGEIHQAGLSLILCGDMNITRSDQDVHPQERRPVIGQRPDERRLFETLLGEGLVDVGRALYPDDDRMFTWWAPWRGMRQRNIGWRLDYVLASAEVAKTATACVVQRDVGTSDHGPVTAGFTITN